VNTHDPRQVIEDLRNHLAAHDRRLAFLFVGGFLPGGCVLFSLLPISPWQRPSVNVTASSWRPMVAFLPAALSFRLGFEGSRLAFFCFLFFFFVFLFFFFFCFFFYL